MVSFVLIVVLALYAIPPISGEPVRPKRQADISCSESSETEIITAFLFNDEKTCPQLIGGISDWYNEDFRNECASWLKLAVVPSDVSQTHVSECYQYSNGTTKYRTKICCHGKPNIPSEDRLVCFSCNRDPVQYESQISYYHTHHCNHYSGDTPLICAAGEACAVELHYNESYRNGLVSKSCMPASTCASLEGQNSQTCISRAEPYCAYCYDNNYGNYDHPITRPYVRGPCYPNPCYYSGTCLSNGTEYGDHYVCLCPPGYYGDRCENVYCYNGGTWYANGTDTDVYICLCRPGYSGSRCQTNPCSYQPCENGGVCSTSTSYPDPYYLCRCRLAWVGHDCDQMAPLCANNWCLNGGTCYIQDGPDERCLCPSGYVGKHCEYPRPYDCGEDGELRRYTRTFNIYYSYDCTYYNDVYLQRYMNSYISNCYSQLRSRFDPSRPLYTPGIHGEGGLNQAVSASHCEQGRDYTWATMDICCASCGSNPCQNGGWCMQDEHSERFICRCRFNYAGTFCEKKLSSCYAAGDPHYYTFDGIRMHYQGVCKYVMTENHDVDDLPYFRVTTKNEHRADSPKFVTYPKYAEVEVYGFKVRLAMDNQAYVDGALVSLPYEDPTGQRRFSIIFNGLKLRMETNFGLVAEFSDNWIITVRVPADSAGHVDGLCRNFNDDATDDYILPDGNDVTDDPDRDVIIGNYFQVPDAEDPNCPPVTESLPTCDDATTAIIRSNAYCGYIEDTSGPFAQCINSAPDNMVDNYMENCIYDVCAVYDAGEEARKTAACGSLAAFAEVCKSEAAPPNLDWRAATNCEPKCPGDLVYKELATACRITCANPNPEKCSLPDIENCVCEGDTDVVLANDTCVHASVCGCYDEGRQIGDVWCSDDSTSVSECVTCTDCSRPIGIVVTSPVTDPQTQCPDPCKNVECENSGECEEDANSANGYTCQCCPKWGGHNCGDDETYNCQDNSPCNDDTINNSLCPLPQTLYFAHDDPGKFVQCTPSGQCFEMSCVPGLVFDNNINVCNWP